MCVTDNASWTESNARQSWLLLLPIKRAVATQGATECVFLKTLKALNHAMVCVFGFDLKEASRPANQFSFALWCRNVARCDRDSLYVGVVYHPE